MKKIVYFLVIFCLAFTHSIHPLNPQEVLEKIDQNRVPSNTFTVRLKVSTQREGGNAVAELMVRVRDSKKSLVLYTSPPSTKGRVLLMVEDNLWIYIPGTKNALRISPQQQLMGQVSNADVARVVYSVDYMAESVITDRLNQESVLKLTLSAKTKGAAYKSIVLCVNKESFLPIKAEFYALSGRHLKTAYYKNYKPIFGQLRPTLLEIHDQIQKNNITTLEYKDFTLDLTPESFFQKTYMERFSDRH